MLAIFKHKRIKWLLALSVGVFVFGTILFAVLEDWSYVDAFYYTVATVTTVGFGDVVVESPASKIIASIFMLLTVPLILIAIEFTVEVVYGDLIRDHSHPMGPKKKKK